MKDHMDTEKKHLPAGKKYISPKSKLIRFFEKSRDKWKIKAMNAKYQIKLLRQKNKYLEQKKKEFKERSRNLEIELQQMNAREKRMRDEIEQLKKNL